MQHRTKFISTRQAGDWLGVRPRTLERYRGAGEGPAFYRFGGHVRYLKMDLHEWAERRRRTSTRDGGNARRAEARWHGRRSAGRPSGARRETAGQATGSPQALRQTQVEHASPSVE